MSARFCSKCGAPFRARGEVMCGLCGEPRIRRAVDEPEPALPPEIEAQLAAMRPVTSAPKRSPIMMGCLGLTVVGILIALASSFCLRDVNVNPNPDPNPTAALVTPDPFGAG
ncbi:MAG: hypothetical protein WD826_10675 [Actinomycetota bacterium]